MKEKQSYDPYPSKDKTVCGDCGTTLSVNGKRIADIFFKDGVRCTTCYNKKINENMKEGTRNLNEKQE
jgi:hypothetical protein